MGIFVFLVFLLIVLGTIKYWRSFEYDSVLEQVLEYLGLENRRVGEIFLQPESMQVDFDDILVQEMQRRNELEKAYMGRRCSSD